MVDTLKTTAPHIHGATTFADLVDWGVQADAIEGSSASTGRLLFKGPNNQPETGIWVCTPGKWRLSIPRDEFCHFVKGSATYRSDDGEVIEVSPGTAVMFKAGWTGECTVHETMRNIYMLA
ncbi:MAG: cupin domain-containing protein [Allorhizobium sp.]